MGKVLARIIVLCAAASLAACGAFGGSGIGSGSVTAPKGGGVYKVGNPYQVAGIWYYPKEDDSYDETGIASWYGADFHGKLTANGEIFDRNAVTAAHKTLPLPVNVRVTNLENGKSIVVRVNDRGPYVNGRIIDLSEKAADLLGYRIKGTAKVRVTYLGRADLNGPGLAPPAEQIPAEVVTAVAAAPVGTVTATPLPPVPGASVEPSPQVADLPQPTPQAANAPVDENAANGDVEQVPVPPVTGIYVQAGAYSSLDNAMRVVDRLKSLGAKVQTTNVNGKPLYRVRIGPMQDVDQADSTLAQVHDLGHNDVKIVVE